jgi:predicted MFS family arabinose efflux permease
MLFVQNLTDHWESWAYGWTVILMAVGVGIFIMGAFGGQESQRQAGLRVLKIGAVLFILFGAFFEMIFNSSNLAQIIFPVALILLGGYLLVARSGLLVRKKDETAPLEPPQS